VSLVLQRQPPSLLAHATHADSLARRSQPSPSCTGSGQGGAADHGRQLGGSMHARVHLPCGGSAAGERSLGVDTARAGIESLEGRGRRGSGAVA